MPGLAESSPHSHCIPPPSSAVAAAKLLGEVDGVTPIPRRTHSRPLHGSKFHTDIGRCECPTPKSVGRHLNCYPLRPISISPPPSRWSCAPWSLLPRPFSHTGGVANPWLGPCIDVLVLLPPVGEGRRMAARFGDGPRDRRAAVPCGNAGAGRERDGEGGHEEGSDASSEAG